MAAEGIGGLNEAQTKLGFMYLKGKGVPRDYTEAAKLFHKATEGFGGDTEAQNNLGLMYLKGQGIPRDYVTAYMWFSLAAAKGDEDSQKILDDLERKLTPDQIAEGQKLAREWQAKQPYYP